MPRKSVVRNRHLEFTEMQLFLMVEQELEFYAFYVTPIEPWSQCASLSWVKKKQKTILYSQPCWVLLYVILVGRKLLCALRSQSMCNMLPILPQAPRHWFVGDIYICLTLWHYCDIEDCNEFHYIICHYTPCGLNGSEIEIITHSWILQARSELDLLK